MTAIDGRNLRWRLLRVLAAVGSVTAVTSCGSPGKTGEPPGADVHTATSALIGSQPDQSVIAATENRLTAGPFSNCMILGSGALKCWGLNDQYQLGIGVTGNRGDDPGEMGSMLSRLELGAGLTARSVAMSTSQACALLGDGSVKCWGSNASGALGLDNDVVALGQPGANGDPLSRVQLPAGRTVRSLVAGASSFFCAILDTGDVRCWGRNQYGQLGIGDKNDRGTSSAPVEARSNVDLGTGRKAISIAAGTDHACAILDNGKVKCWGRNDGGQLGTGDITWRGDDASNPKHQIVADGVPLGSGRTAVALAAGRAHTCARLDDASVKCWGTNSSGQLGIGTRDPRGLNGTDDLGDDLPPVDFGSGRAVRSLVAGADHNCAILTNGELKCWGANGSGQLGIESTVEQGASAGTLGVPNPATGDPGMRSVSLGTLRTVRAVAAGGDHTCAWLDDGSVKCWGSNANGESGIGMPFQHGHAPNTMGDKLPAAQLRQSMSVNAVTNHVCAVLDDGSVKCWGANDGGQLGIGRTGSMGWTWGQMGTALQKLHIGAGRTALMVTTGRAHSCVLLDDHSVKCWGANEHGQLGQGNNVSTGLTGGYEFLDGVNPINFGNIKPISIASGGDTNCAIFDDTTLRCWGSSNNYQLGNASTTPIGVNPNEMANLPVIPVGAGRTATAVTLSHVHVCVLLDNHSVKCWGLNQFGQVGLSSATYYQKTPPSSSINLGGDAVVSVAAGWGHTCALLSTGNVKCWGKNDYGQLGLNNTGTQWVTTAQIPIAILGNGRRAIAITTGSNHTCAMLDDGSPRCWGYNGYGQTGPVGEAGQTSYGDAAGEMENLHDVPLGTAASTSTIYAEGNFTCAILNDGRSKCWGYNVYGQLGQGNRNANNAVGYVLSEMGDNLPAIDLGIDRPAISVAAGDFFSCAILENGPVKCWGKNDSGQLGVGDTSSRGTTPAQLGKALPATLLGSGRAARMLAAGATHVCALLDNGNVKCWGGNASGQLGLGDSTNHGSGPNQMGDNLSVVQLGTGRTAISLTAGTAHTCALLEEGDVVCWGANAQGQLGVGNANPVGGAANQMGDALIGVRFGKGRKARSIAAERNHTCALLDNASVKCWGENTGGDLGIDKPDTSWGDQRNELGDSMPAVDLGTTTPGSSPPGPLRLAILVGPSCAVVESGDVKCWGDNASGQLGIGTTAPHGVAPGDMGDSLPLIQLGGAHVLGLAARDDHKCAVLDDGTVKCWGNNASGQLGIGRPDASRGSSLSDMGTGLPIVSLGSGRSVQRASVGLSHSCALLDNGTVKCWGLNADGELGIGTNISMGTASNQMGDFLPAVSVGDSDVWNGAAPNATGQCATVDDHDPCTVDGCDPATGVTHTRTCSSACPCSGADGICTSDTGCVSGEVCGVNNGRFFGHQRSDRLCWGSTCSQNALESCGTPTSPCGTVCSAAKPCGNDIDCGTGEVCGHQNGSSFSSTAQNVCWPAACDSQPRQTGCGTLFSPCGLCPAVGLHTFVAYAQKSITLGTGDQTIGGDIGVASLAAESAAQLIVGAQDHLDTTATLVAPSISLGAQSIVGNIQSNAVTNGGSASTGTVQAYPSGLPPLPMADPSVPSTTNITVAQGQTQTLSPGSFGVLTVNGTIQLNPGTYSFASVALGDSAQLRALASGITQVRVAGNFTTGSGAQLSAQAGQVAKTLSISVSGIDGTDGSPAMSLGANTRVVAILNAPRGTLSFGSGTNATGAFAAFSIVAGDNVTLNYDSGFPPSSQQVAGLQHLTGYANTHGAPVVGPVPPSTPVILSVSLPVRTPPPAENFPSLKEFTQQVADPNNARFRQFITDDQYARYYRPSEDDYNALKSFAQSHGLSVLNAYDDHELLDVSATVGEMQPALHAQLNYYLRPDGTTFYSLDRDPSIEFTKPILRISGTNNFSLPAPSVATGDSGMLIGNDFRNAYVPNCLNIDGSNLDGNGQSIAVLILEGYNPADLNAYDTRAMIPPPPQNPPAGWKWTPTGLVGGIAELIDIGSVTGATEAPMDIQLAHAMAPAAAIITYEGVNFSGGFLVHDYQADLVHGAAHPPGNLPRSAQVTTSWNMVKDDDIEQSLNVMAAYGQSFVTSSGDGGSSTTNFDDIRSYYNVTLVGGTNLVSFGPGMLTQQTAWAQSTGAGGGGYLGASDPLVSIVVDNPGVGLPSYQKDLPLIGGVSNQWRNFPDISMPAQNIESFVTVNPLGKIFRDGGVPGTAILNGGTSASAPLFAGFMALVNQKGASQGLRGVGFINPTLYAIGMNRALAATSFIDAAGGQIPPTPSGGGYIFSDAATIPPGGFAAIPGYDLATGWGSPTCGLLNQLASVTPLIPVTPAAPPPLTGVAPSFAGFGFADTCASNGGVVECWGGDANGENGTGANGLVDTTQHLSPACPAFTASGWTVSSVTMGSGHACVKKAQDGTIWCWGANGFGQLGLNALDSATNQPRPKDTMTEMVGLPPGDRPLQLSAGGDTTCALLESGDIWCWGRNDQGQLGIGTTNTLANPRPAKVQGLPPAIQVAVDGFGDYVCALTGQGVVSCWGSGPLGNPAFTSSPSPHAVMLAFDLGPITHATYIATGTTHACAIIANSGQSPGDGLWCWGDNSMGQLGVGNTSDSPPFVARPASVFSGQPKGVACGTRFTCALLQDGSAQCWGDNESGQLGIGSQSNQAMLTPQQVLGFTGATDIQAGRQRVCARLPAFPMCWGKAPAGDGTSVNVTIPKVVEFSHCL